MLESTVNTMDVMDVLVMEENLVEGLLAELEAFKNENVVVSLDSSISGLWFLNNFDCAYVQRKNGTAVIILEANDGTEASIVIEVQDIDTYIKDEISGNLYIDLNNAEITIYKQ